MPTKPRTSGADCTYEFLAADEWPCDRCTLLESWIPVLNPDDQTVTTTPGEGWWLDCSTGEWHVPLDDRIDEHEAMMRRVPAWKRFLLSLLP